MFWDCQAKLSYFRFVWVSFLFGPKWKLALHKRKVFPCENSCLSIPWSVIIHYKYNVFIVEFLEIVVIPWDASLAVVPCFVDLQNSYDLFRRSTSLPTLHKLAAQAVLCCRKLGFIDIHLIALLSRLQLAKTQNYSVWCLK